jgi:hypothetical protein
MTDTDTDTDTPDDATAVPPPPEERAFEQLTALIALIVDPEAVKSRFAELGRESRRVARARIELSQEASRHAEAVRRERAEIEAERKSLAEREKALRQGEAGLEARLEILSRPPDPNARLRHFPGGMAAEPDDEPPSRASDPHFGRPSTTASDDEMVMLEKVGPSTGTLTRSVPVPKPRRSLRKAQPDA